MRVILSFQEVFDLADCMPILSPSVMAVTLGGNGDMQRSIILLEGWVCHQLELSQEHTRLQQTPDQPYCIVVSLVEAI